MLSACGHGRGYYSFMVVDDFKEIIQILASHIDSMSDDQYIFNQFPFDHDENLFTVTPGGRLQVPQL